MLKRGTVRREYARYVKHEASTEIGVNRRVLKAGGYGAGNKERMLGLYTPDAYVDMLLIYDEWMSDRKYALRSLEARKSFVRNEENVASTLTLMRLIAIVSKIPKDNQYHLFKVHFLHDPQNNLILNSLRDIVNDGL
ncbi:hypothetical protein Trydic_g16427 [Trypoxylus dichotomus]